MQRVFNFLINSRWRFLAETYGTSISSSQKKGKIEMVFYWEDSSATEIDYYNSMYVYPSESSLIIYPTMNNILVPSVSIPWTDISIVGFRRFWLRKRIVLHIESMGFNIAILKKWIKVLPK